MSPIQDSDLLLINRGGRDFSIEAKDIKDKAADDDLLVVHRDGVDYQVTAAELKEYALTKILPLGIKLNLSGASALEERIKHDY